MSPLKKDAYLEIGHLGMALDDAIVVAVAIEEEQSVFLTKGDAGLIEQTIVETDILALGFAGDEYTRMA